MRVPRRRVLAGAASGASGLLAGCAGSLDPLGRRCEPLDQRRDVGIDLDEVSLPVPRNELIKAAGTDEIRAIVDPVFASGWEDLDDRLGEETGQALLPSDLVLGVERDGRARAYPLQVLYTHEIVNDEFGGPLLATFCPICGSSVTAERRVGGEPTTFGVSGYLWRADLVMYDRATESLWSQIAATAIRGPRVGETLTLVPSELTTWADWRQRHPGTDVLLPPPLSGALGATEYKPYYLPFERDELLRDTDPAGDHTAVQGLVVNGEARAYPFPVVARERVVNDRLGGHPVLVAVVPDGGLVAFDRCVEGRELAFKPAGEGLARAGGSRWNLATGLARDGPHEGTRLARLGGSLPMFWFAWREFHPETTRYGTDAGESTGVP